MPAKRRSTLADEDLPAEALWRVGDYCRTIETARNDDERYRMIIHDLPRRFHASSRDGQVHALAEAPPLTGTNWDALLAAVAEHIAIIHDHPIPDWCDEPERFLDIPWLPARIGGMDMASSWVDSPGAFLRHGALPDPADLDERGGERDYGSLL